MDEQGFVLGEPGVAGVFDIKAFDPFSADFVYRRGERPGKFPTGERRELLGDLPANFIEFFRVAVSDKEGITLLVTVPVRIFLAQNRI